MGTERTPRQRSSRFPRTGLMSSTGVPSTASRASTLMRPSATSVTLTVWRPIGFGRSGERVVKTPGSGRSRSHTRVDAQDRPVGQVQPGQDDEPVPRGDARRRCPNPGFEDGACRRRPRPPGEERWRGRSVPIRRGRLGRSWRPRYHSRSLLCWRADDDLVRRLPGIRNRSGSDQGRRGWRAARGASSHET
jgi:hypothetical protein